MSTEEVKIPIGNADIKIKVSDKPMTDDERKKWAKRLSEQMMSFGLSDSDDEMLKAIHGSRKNNGDSDDAVTVTVSNADHVCPNMMAGETLHRHGPSQDPHVCPMSNILKHDGMTAVQLCQCCEWCESNCWEDANK